MGGKELALSWDRAQLTGGRQEEGAVERACSVPRKQQGLRREARSVLGSASHDNIDLHYS